MHLSLTALSSYLLLLQLVRGLPDRYHNYYDASESLWDLISTASRDVPMVGGITYVKPPEDFKWKPVDHVVDDKEEEQLDVKEAEKKYFRELVQYYKDLRAYRRQHGLAEDGGDDEAQVEEEMTMDEDEGILSKIASIFKSFIPAEGEKDTRRTSVADEKQDDGGLFSGIPFIPEDPALAWLAAFTALGLFTQGVLFPHGKVTVSNPGTVTGRKKRGLACFSCRFAPKD